MSKDIFFSAYLNAEAKIPIRTSFLEVMAEIKDGTHHINVERIRISRPKVSDEQYQANKRTLYCFTTGVNSSKKGKGSPLPQDMTGLVCLDIDDKSQDQKKNKEKLISIPWVLAVGFSAGGVGLFAVVKGPAGQHRTTFANAAKLLGAEGLQVKVADGQQNENRLRYTSYDPDIWYVADPVSAPSVPGVDQVPQNSANPIETVPAAGFLPEIDKPAVSTNRAAVDTGINDKPHIFEKIFKVKTRDITTVKEGERHAYLRGIVAWCNHIGMSQDFVLAMTEKYCRGILENGADYPMERKVAAWYREWKSQHGTCEWRDGMQEPPEEIEYEKYRITAEMNIPETPAVIMIGNAKVSVAGNITPVTAESKNGKSGLTTVFLAGGISKDGDIDGFTDVWVMPNPDGLAVIHFDTEQSHQDQQYNVKTVLRRARMDHTPDYFHSYNIRTLSLSGYQGFTNSICQLCADHHGGIHLIVVDGAADFISSVNDEQEANAIIQYFTKLAEDFACPVILVVHLNENASKNGDTMPRGHLGRQAVRKGYAQLNITRDGDVSVLQALRARKAGNEDTPLVCFRYDREKGYHVSVDAETAREMKTDKKSDIRLMKWKTLAEKVFGGQASLSYTEAGNKLAKATGTKFDNGRKIIKDLIAHEFITQGIEGNYRLRVK